MCMRKLGPNQLALTIKQVHGSEFRFSGRLQINVNITSEADIHFQGLGSITAIAH
ncbi:hypothetical protein D3C81_1994380 [compost metagenome]